VADDLTWQVSVEDGQQFWDEECWRLLERLRAHHRVDGTPVHIDILTDDDDPNIVWPQIYVMTPTLRDGCVVAWWCTGCGYEKPADHRWHP
jgi:hypothetical protein